MPGSQTQPAESPPLIERFSAATRVFHWAVALPFVLLLLTGLLLYLPPIRAVHIGGFRLIPLLHLIAGFALLALLPLVITLAWGRRAVLDDLRQALTPEAGDGQWLGWALYAALGATAEEPPAGKYNAGQKLATALWIVLTLGLLASGVVLGVNYLSKRVFETSFVEQVFPWHTWLAWLSVPLLAGHLYFALLHRPTRHALRGMIGGAVSSAWASRHHARWWADPDRR